MTAAATPNRRWAIVYRRRVYEYSTVLTNGLHRAAALQEANAWIAAHADDDTTEWERGTPSRARAESMHPELEPER